MVQAAKRHAELADAAVSHGNRNLHHGQGGGNQKLGRALQPLLLEVLVERLAV